MTIDVATLGVELDTSGVRRGQDDLRAVEAQGGRTADALEDAGKRGSQGLSMVSTAAKAAAAALATLGVINAAQQIIQINDEYQRLENRLGLVTKGSADLANVQSRLFKLAQDSKTPYAATASLYADMAAAGQELNATQDQMLKVTGAVGASLVVAGRSASEASGAIFQLGQLFGGPIVQAQEYNALLDNMRPLLAAIAENMEGTGGTVAGLTRLVKDGKVETKDFFAAAVKGSDELTASAQGMETTVGQALTVLENDFKKAIASADMAPVVAAIENLRAALNDPAVRDGLATLTGGLANATAGAIEGAAGISGFIKELAELTAAYTTGGAQAAQDRYIAGLSLLRGLAIGGDFAANAASTLLGTGELTKGSALVDLVDGKFKALNQTLQETEPLVNQFASANAPWMNSIDGVVASLVPLPSALEESAAASYLFMTATQQSQNVAKATADAADANVKAEKARKAEIERSAKAVITANANALENAKTLERTTALILEGKSADEAAYRAKSELAGISGSLIERNLAAEKSSKALAEAQEAEAASIDAVIEAMDRRNAIDTDLKSTSDQLYFLQQGATLEHARTLAAMNTLEVQASILQALGDQEGAAQALAQLELLRGQNANQYVADAQAAQKAWLAEGKSASAEVAAAMQADFDRASDRIKQSISDAIIRGGLDSTDDLVDLIANSLKAQAFEIVLNPLLTPLSQGINSVLTQAVSSLGFDTLGSGYQKGVVESSTAFGSPTAGGGLSAAGSALSAAGIAYLGGSMLEGSGPFGKRTGEYAGAGAAAGSLIGSAVGTVVLPGIGTVAGSTVGAVVGTVVGTLASGIIGTWKTKSQDVALSITGGLVDATVITERKKKSLVGSKRKTITDDALELDDGLSDQFSAVFDEISAGAESLGLAVGSFTYNVTESIKGLSGAELDAKLLEIFTGATDALALQVLPSIEQYRLSNESLAQTFVRVVAQANAVEFALDSMNSTLSFSAEGLIDVSDSLVQLSGGLDAFNANFNAYISGFYSASEQTTYLGNQLNAALAEVGLGLPTTSEGFRALVESLSDVNSAINITSVAGQEALAALLSIAGRASQYYSQLTSSGSSTPYNVSNTFVGGSALQVAINAAVAAAKAAAAVAEQNANAPTRAGGGSGSGGSGRSGAADALRSAYDEQVKMYEDMAGRFRDISGDLRGYLSDLNSTASGLVSPLDAYEETRRRFNETKALAATGDEDALRDLRGVSEAFLSASREVNASGAAYASDFTAVRDAVTAAAAYSDFEANLQQQSIDAITTQVGAMIDLSKSVLSLEDAIEAYLGLGGASGGGRSQQLPGESNRTYRDRLREEREQTSGLAGEAARAAARGMTLEEYRQRDGVNIDWVGRFNEVTQPIRGLVGEIPQRGTTDNGSAEIVTTLNRNAEAQARRDAANMQAVADTNARLAALKEAFEQQSRQLGLRSTA